MLSNNNTNNTNVIFGVGSINLDEHVIAANFAPYSVCEVGGSCGNVLSLLARCGWQAVPFLIIDDSETGINIKKLLEKEGVDVTYVHVTQDADSVKMTFFHELDAIENHKRVIKRSGKGKQQISRLFPTEVEIIEAVNKANPKCFYADRLFPGIHAVQKAISSKTIFYFEPDIFYNELGYEQDIISHKSVLEKCTIIKFSAEIFSPNYFDEMNAYDGIIICTQGSNGVLLKKGGTDWIHIPAPKINTKVVDSICAGDCFSASLINQLRDFDCDQVLDFSTEQLVDHINRAQIDACRCLDAFGLIELRKSFNGFK